MADSFRFNKETALSRVKRRERAVILCLAVLAVALLEVCHERR